MLAGHLSDRIAAIGPIYTGGVGGSEVVQYVLLNQGHAWPDGSKGYRRGDEPTHLVSANGWMFEFFKKHLKAR